MALKVEVVSRERVVWTGEAKYVRARSVSGDLGILPGMIPTLHAAGTGRRAAH